ncbi:MAG: carbamoyl phosphate synthase-like protein [Methanoregula sp. PtaU1.Bin051]|nr:MAG: carbamoyl phosphate synthase-like protein [Methanoregula sp. PtaU1.Bin051]
MKGRVLIAGFATRHVAQSAYRAGYEVCAVDHFCDQDLNWYTKDRIKFEELDDLAPAVEEMSSRHRFDMLVVTSGAEDLQSAISLCGTPPGRVLRFLDKLATQQFFEDIPVSVPRLAGEGEYPYIIKPRRGAGGWRNAIIRNGDELTAWENLYDAVPYIRQQIVSGVPASVCCVTDGTRARAIASNEQILRGEGGSGFGFCGSITPYSGPQAGAMITLAEKIAAASGCTGTIGIDFILGDEIYAIEVNPRFQATVDTVEMATGCNLFTLHTGACNGILPGTLPLSGQYAARKILFADRDMTIAGDLKELSPVISDIPWPGTELEKDQAITSVYGWGRTRSEALGVLDKNITSVQQYLR